MGTNDRCDSDINVVVRGFSGSERQHGEQINDHVTPRLSVIGSPQVQGDLLSDATDCSVFIKNTTQRHVKIFIGFKPTFICATN